MYLGALGRGAVQNEDGIIGELEDLIELTWINLNTKMLI
jgi:hypothetical protein